MCFVFVVVCVLFLFVVVVVCVCCFVHFKNLVIHCFDFVLDFCCCTPRNNCNG